MNAGGHSSGEAVGGKIAAYVTGCRYSGRTRQGGTAMDESERKALGREVRGMRKARKLKQTEVADLAHIGVRTVRNLEAGRSVSDGSLGAVMDVVGYRRRDWEWDEETKAFLEMVGVGLSRLDAETRAQRVGEITRLIIAPTQES